MHSLNQPPLEAQKPTVLLRWEKALVESRKRALPGTTGSNGRQPRRLSISLPQLSWGSDSVLFVTRFTLAWLVLSESLPWRLVVNRGKICSDHSIRAVG